MLKIGPKSKGPIKNARKAINEIALDLKKGDFVEIVGIQATEVFIGGSVGQGTTVPRKYDVDIVLYSRDLHYLAAVDNDGYEDVLMKLKEYLTMTLGANYTHEDHSKVALKFNYQVPKGRNVKVDLLLSPFWESQEHFFSDLANVSPPTKRLLFSAGTSKYQTMFIKHMKPLDLTTRQCSRVKELIRRAKAWMKNSWRQEEKSGKPKSYLMSLLVITAYCHLQEPKSAKQVFKKLARRVGEKMKLLVLRIATDDQLDLTIPGTDPFIRERYAHLLPDKPRIVDPVNPSNNLYLSGVGKDPYDRGSGRWGEFKDKVTSITLDCMR